MLSDYDDPLKVLQSFVGMLEDTVESTAWVSLNSSFLSQHIHHSQLLGIWDADRLEMDISPESWKNAVPGVVQDQQVTNAGIHLPQGRTVLYALIFFSRAPFRGHAEIDFNWIHISAYLKFSPENPPSAVTPTIIPVLRKPELSPWHTRNEDQDWHVYISLSRRGWTCKVFKQPLKCIAEVLAGEDTCKQGALSWMQNLPWLHSH